MERQIRRLGREKGGVCGDSRFERNKLEAAFVLARPD